MKKNKLISLLFSSVLTLTLASCGNNGDSWEKQSGYNEIDDEDVKEITIFKNDWAMFNESRTENSPIYSTIKNKINCDIKAENSAYETFEANLLLRQQDEDLPDIFLTNGPDNASFFKKMIDNEDLLAISDWVSDEHYPNIYNYLKQFEFLKSNISYADGKMYFIPSSWHLEKSLYVRTDWIDNLNAKLDDILVKEKIVSNKSQITDELRNKWKYKIPDTLLEFYRLARAFTLYDPDNNKQDDTYGYVSEKNTDMDAWIYIAFDTGWNQFVKDGDSYTYSDITDGSKKATAFITRLLAEKYMSYDSLTLDNGGKQQRFGNGKAGMMYAHNWYNVIIGDIMASQQCDLATARNKVAIVEPPMGENGSHGGPGDKGYWQGFCINANMSNSRIRKCLELYDYLLSEEGYKLLQYGVENVHYSIDENNEYVSKLPLDADGKATSLPYTDKAANLYALVDWTMHYRSLTQTNADIIVPRQKESEKNSYISDYPAITTTAYIEHMDSCHGLFEETISKLKTNANEVYYTPSDTESYNPTTFTYADLYSFANEGQFRNVWRGFVEKYKSASYGGQEIIDEYNSYITSGKAKKVTISDYIFK